jgi:Na+/H+ antiporter NhaC
MDSSIRNPKRWMGFLACLALICLIFPGLPAQVPDGFEGEVIGHWSSVLPPFLAVLIALFFRNLLMALSCAFFLGAVLAFGPIPWIFLPAAFQHFIWSNLVEPFNLLIIFFLFSLAGTINVTYRGGGIEGLVIQFQKFTRTQRSTKLAAMISGLVIFFDDYANTVVVGSTMRGLTDRWRVSREKLAYIVDSTAAPVAGLAIVSTWIAFEVSLFSQMSEQLHLQEGGYAIFVKAIPFRFYCWGTLIFVFLCAFLGRDFGPMLKAETRAVLEDKVVRDGARLIVRENAHGLELDPSKPKRWYNAGLPLATVIFGILAGILILGGLRLIRSGESFSILMLSDWRAAFGAATNPALGEAGAMYVLFGASLLGGCLAILLAVSQKILCLRNAAGVYLQAIPNMCMAIFILIMAWAMKEICTQALHTDTFLVSLLRERLPLWLLPLFTFVIASLTAFATGTSFGTMGILIPVVLPLAHAMGAYEESHRLIFWLTAAAVLDGAIFGDHCSPISDTTVLSSIASGCDHIDHMETQMVYAITVMVFAGTAGYLALSLGLPPWSFFILLPVLCAATLLSVGKPIPKPEHLKQG